MEMGSIEPGWLNADDVARRGRAGAGRRPVRHRHRVHVRGALPRAALPRPGGGGQPGRAGGEPLIYLIDSLGDVDVSPLAAAARRPRDRGRPARRPPGRRDPAPGVADRAQQHLRHPDLRRLRRSQRPGRLRQPARRGAGPARRQDRQLHALGRPAAHRRAARLRRRGRRPPARSSPTRSSAACRRAAGWTGRARSAAAWSRPPTSVTPRRPGSACPGSGSWTPARARSPASWPPGVSAPRPSPTARSARSSPTRRSSSWPSDGRPTLSAMEQIRGLHPPTIKRRGEAILEAIARGREAPPIPRDEAPRPVGARRRPAHRAGRGAAARPGARGRARLRADRVPRRAGADRRRGPPRRARAGRPHAERLAARARRR